MNARPLPHSSPSPLAAAQQQPQAARCPATGLAACRRVALIRESKAIELGHVRSRLEAVPVGKVHNGHRVFTFSDVIFSRLLVLLLPRLGCRWLHGPGAASSMCSGRTCSPVAALLPRRALQLGASIGPRPAAMMAGPSSHSLPWQSGLFPSQLALPCLGRTAAELERRERERRKRAPQLACEQQTRDKQGVLATQPPMRESETKAKAQLHSARGR
jgi:hypothetical protein